MVATTPGLERALQRLESVRVETAEAPMAGELVSYGLFDWYGWREDLAEKIHELTAAATGSPVSTAQAVTFTGWSPRFETVWLTGAKMVDVDSHWAAVDAQNERRIQVLGAIATVMRLTREVLAVASAGWNPVGAIGAARNLLESLEEVLGALQITG